MERCDCQIQLDTFFQLLGAAPTTFFSLWLDNTLPDGVSSMTSLAATCPAWTASLVDACLTQLVDQTLTREDVFRQDSATTRCLKTLVSTAFTTAVRPTLVNAVSRLLAKDGVDVAAQAARLLHRLAAVALPPIVQLTARRVSAAFEAKFPGAGRIALVGLFWLRLLCPLLIRLGGEVVPPPKPSRAARVLELVKLLQAQANDVAGGLPSPGWDAALEPLLAGADHWPQRRPDNIAVQTLFGWLVSHSLQLGRTLKCDKRLLLQFGRSRDAMRAMQFHQHDPEPVPAVSAELDPVAQKPGSTGITSFLRLRMPRMPAATSQSVDALREPSPRWLPATAPLAFSTGAVAQQTLTDHEQLLNIFQSFSATSVTPIKIEQREVVPPLFACFQPDRTHIEAWQPADVANWLVSSQLDDLIDPFRAADIDGKQLLALHRRSSVFADNSVKIGIVHQFLAAQRALLRSTRSVFDDEQFDSAQEQVLAMKELLVRIANHITQPDAVAQSSTSAV